MCFPVRVWNEKEEENEKEGKEGCVVWVVSLQLFPFEPLSINGWKEELEGFFARKKGETDVFKNMCLFYSAKKRFWTKFSGIKTVI